MGATPKLTRRRLVAYFTDQARPPDDRRGTKVPIEWVILQLADRWHLHPADVDPEGQRPRRSRWFYWALEAYELREQMAPKKPPRSSTNTPAN